MKMNVKISDNTERQTLLKPQKIIKYFLRGDKEIEKVILSGDSKSLITTDHSVYEALGSISESDKFNWRKLVKFLEVIKIVSYENVYRRKKPILTEQRVEQLRKLLEEKNDKTN